MQKRTFAINLHVSWFTMIQKKYAKEYNSGLYDHHVVHSKVETFDNELAGSFFIEKGIT